MNTTPDPDALPEELPVPEDDGACDHLRGRALPALALPSTEGDAVDLSRLAGRVVVYVYPRTGRPGEPLPDGWDALPLARSQRRRSGRSRSAGAAVLAGHSRRDLRSVRAPVIAVDTNVLVYAHRREAAELVRIDPFSAPSA